MSRFGTIGERVQQGSAYVLLFLLPFSKAAVEIGFAVLLMGWLATRLDPDTRADSVWVRRSLKPLGLAVGAFLLACALSLVTSDHVVLSVRGLINKWLEYLLFFIMMADLGRRPGFVTRSLIVVGASASAVIVEGVAQELLGKGLFRGYPLSVYGRMTGPYENPIDLATYFMVVIPLLMAAGLGSSSRGVKRAMWVVILLASVCTARTGALGAWIGLGLGVLIMACSHDAFHRMGAVVLALLLIGSAIFIVRRENVGTVFSFSDIGSRDRLAMWQAALGMIRDRPVLGHGVNTFMSNYLAYWVGGEQQPRYAHNCYLQMAAETGIVGLAAFLWLLWSLMARLVRAIRRARWEDRAVLLGFFAGLLAFIVQSGVDTNFYALRQVALFWVLAGLAVGLSVRVSDDAGSGAPPVRRA
ncbi:MAG: O-antigen ligase family protein [Candidatus Omnitrophica bacterium]|nr:O-antigen ligase family protein [Candidatus Omnitrophota bacterium]